MTHLYLAEYQVRLLLCTPVRKKPLAAAAGAGAVRLTWRCGCSAVPCADGKYQITACGEHFSLLRLVREGDDRFYDAPGDRQLYPIPRTRFRNFRVI
jgi:hypothetical protein